MFLNNNKCTIISRLILMWTIEVCQIIKGLATMIHIFLCISINIMLICARELVKKIYRLRMQKGNKYNANIMQFRPRLRCTVL